MTAPINVAVKVGLNDAALASHSVPPVYYVMTLIATTVEPGELPAGLANPSC